MSAGCRPCLTCLCFGADVDVGLLGCFANTLLRPRSPPYHMSPKGMTTHKHGAKVLIHPNNYGRPLGRVSSQSTYHIWCVLILAGSGAEILHVCMVGTKYCIFLFRCPIWNEGKDRQPQKARGPANNISHGYSWQFNDQCIDKAQSWNLLVGSFYYLTLTCNQHRVMTMNVNSSPYLSERY